MIRYLPVIIFVLMIGCVSSADYNALEQENKELKRQIDDLKFGAKILMSDANKFYKAKDYASAREKLRLLLEKHADQPESLEAKKILAIVDEEEAWENSTDLATSESYLQNYPNGKYRNSVRAKIEEFRRLNESSEYENALLSNSSSAWRNFISNYPNRADREDIEKRIIDSEVREIMGVAATGRLPTFVQTSYEYSSSSSISVTNDTGCELTVRYSGVDSRRIDIPAGATRTVSLLSGSYKIAASACGANYAGVESLSGSYSSKYYISTSRY
jgi:hypothetical protein